MNSPSRLMNWNFFMLWQGQTVSLIGVQLAGIAMMLWIKHATGSATLMGVITMAATLPGVILGPVGGTFADRYSRRSIIIFSNILRGIAILFIGAQIYISQDADFFTLSMLFMVSIFLGVVGSFLRPSVSAIIPDLVPKDKFKSANALIQFSLQLSTFIGQGVGAVLFRIIGTPAVFLVDGLAYMYAAISASFIRVQQAIPEKSAHWQESFAEFKRDLIDSFHYVWHRIGMRTMFIGSAFLNFFFIPCIILMPFYVEDCLHLKPDWMGYMLATSGIGVMIGVILAGSIKFSGKGRSRAILSFFLGTAVLVGLLGLVHVPFISLMIMFFIGILTGFINICVVTIIQIMTPPEIMGRVFGLQDTLSNALSPVAMGLTGIIADLTGQNIPLIFVSCGIITMLLSIIISFNKEFRDFLDGT